MDLPIHAPFSHTYIHHPTTHLPNIYLSPIPPNHLQSPICPSIIYPHTYSFIPPILPLFHSPIIHHSSFLPLPPSSIIQPPLIPNLSIQKPIHPPTSHPLITIYHLVLSHNLPIHLAILLSFIYHSTGSSIHISFSPSTNSLPPIHHPSTYPSTSPFTHLSTNLFFSPTFPSSSIFPLMIHPSPIHPFIHPPIHPFIHLITHNTYVHLFIYPTH